MTKSHFVVLICFIYFVIIYLLLYIRENLAILSRNISYTIAKFSPYYREILAIVSHF